MLQIMSGGKSQPQCSIEPHWSLPSPPAPGSEKLSNWSTELSKPAKYEIGLWLVVSVNSVSGACSSEGFERRWVWVWVWSLVLPARNSFFFFSLVFQWFFTSLSVLPGSWEAMVDHLTNNTTVNKLIFWNIFEIKLVNRTSAYKFLCFIIHFLLMFSRTKSNFKN